MVQRRQSLHTDEKSSRPGKHDVYRRCNNCKVRFWINDDKQPVVIIPKQYEELKELKDKHPNLYPDLDDDITYHCDKCKTTDVRENVPPLQKHLVQEAALGPAILQAAPAAAAMSMKVPWLGALGFFGFMVVSMCYNNNMSDLVEDVMDYIPYLKKEVTFDVNIPTNPKEVVLFEEELYGLEKTYTKQHEDVWLTFVAGIKSVVRVPNQPAVFLMLYDDDAAKKTAECIARDVSKPAIKLLMRRPKQPVMVAAENLKADRYLNDAGQLLVDYNQTVRERGALIVTEVQDTPAEVATSFHYFCDRYSPLIRRAVLFFTLKVNSIKRLKLKEVAENRLAEIWSTLPSHLLDPLITRMTTSVIKISSDVSNC